MNTTALDNALERLRILIHAQVLWLRRRWAAEPAARYQGIAITDAEVDGILDSANSSWEARAAFFRDDPEASALFRLLDADTAQGTPGQLGIAQDLFLLSDFEREVLLLALAVELDPGFERLYAYLQDDAASLLPTPGLAIALFAAGPEQAAACRAAFSGNAPLFRYNLLAWAAPGRGGLLSRPCRLDERMAGFLTGDVAPDARIAQALTVLREETLPPDLFAAQTGQLEIRIRGLLENPGGNAGRLIVNLVGEDPGIARCIAAEVCRRLPVTALHCDPEALPRAGLGSHEILPLLFREALLQPAAFFLESPVAGTVPADGSPAADARPLLQAMSDYAALTFVASDRRWPPRTDDPRRYGCTRLELALPPLDFTRRRRLWLDGMRGLAAAPSGTANPATLAAELANRFRFGGDQVRATLQLAAESAALARQAGPSAADIAAAARTLPVHRLDALARKVSSSFTWEDIVLPDDSREQLGEIAHQFRFREKVYGAWGFETKMARGKGICVLFSGPSGTGKTMAAEILANDLGLELYRIDLSAVVSKYIGETEKNLSRVFDEGEKSQAILFFDEADALFGKRSEVRDSHDRYANIEINYLLQRMESYTGASILATNMRAAIDPAFLRRLRAIVEFPMPDAGQREAIWRKSFPAAAELNGVDFRYLAKHYEISGGNIKNAAVNAAFLAAAADQIIAMDHVTRAVRREYAKMGKLCTEGRMSG